MFYDVFWTCRNLARVHIEYWKIMKYLLNSCQCWYLCLSSWSLTSSCEDKEHCCHSQLLSVYLLSCIYGSINPKCKITILVLISHAHLMNVENLHHEMYTSLYIQRVSLSGPSISSWTYFELILNLLTSISEMDVKMPHSSVNTSQTPLNQIIIEGLKFFQDFGDWEFSKSGV